MHTWAEGPPVAPQSPMAPTPGAVCCHPEFGQHLDPRPDGQPEVGEMLSSRTLVHQARVAVTGRSACPQRWGTAQGKRARSAHRRQTCWPQEQTVTPLSADFRTVRSSTWGRCGASKGPGGVVSSVSRLVVRRLRPKRSARPRRALFTPQRTRWTRHVGREVARGVNQGPSQDTDYGTKVEDRCAFGSTALPLRPRTWFSSRVDPCAGRPSHRRRAQGRFRHCASYSAAATTLDLPNDSSGVADPALPPARRILRRSRREPTYLASAPALGTGLWSRAASPSHS